MSQNWLISLWTAFALFCAVCAACANMCPAPVDIHPCTCSRNFWMAVTMLECSHMEKVSDLEKVLEQSMDYQLNKVGIYSSVLKFIPVKSFQIKKITHIDVKDSKLLNLFDFDRGVTEDQDSIKEISLTNVTVGRGVDWQDFTPLTHLKGIILKGVKPLKITKTFSQYVSETLYELYLTDNGLKKLVDNCFAKFSNLGGLGISHSNIKTLKRNMFPDNINHFTFKHNKVSSLPADLFEGMSKLIGVYFDENLLTTIDENIFGPIISLQVAKFYNNPLVCDCRMKWILGSSVKFEGICAAPTKMKGRYFEGLQENHFGHCSNF